MAYDVEAIRADFPILSREVHGKPLVYLDNGASAQKPKAVIDAIDHVYSHEYANVHRGLHYLSNATTEAYEASREKVRSFLNAPSVDEIVFTKGTTEAINLVAYGWAMKHLKAGDEIVISIMEHHSNIVPWHFLRERLGVKLVWVDVEEDGSFAVEKFRKATVSPSVPSRQKMAASRITCLVDATSMSCINAMANGVSPVAVMRWTLPISYPTGWMTLRRQD